MAIVAPIAVLGRYCPLGSTTCPVSFLIQSPFLMYSVSDGQPLIKCSGPPQKWQPGFLGRLMGIAFAPVAAEGVPPATAFDRLSILSCIARIIWLNVATSGTSCFTANAGIEMLRELANIGVGSLLAASDGPGVVLESKNSAASRTSSVR